MAKSGLKVGLSNMMAQILSHLLEQKVGPFLYEIVVVESREGKGLKKCIIKSQIIWHGYQGSAISTMILSNRIC